MQTAEAVCLPNPTFRLALLTFKLVEAVNVMKEDDFDTCQTTATGLPGLLRESKFLACCDSLDGNESLATSLHDDGVNKLSLVGGGKQFSAKPVANFLTARRTSLQSCQSVAPVNEPHR